MRRLILAPIHDFFAALQAAVPEPPWGAMAAAGLGAVACWWIYVPAHELLHAFGCLAAGGSVSRLEISPEYGAALLHEIFPFVHVGSEYAGRLSGFDTHGSDVTYLVTVFAPYLLTVLIGVPLLRRVGKITAPGIGASIALGASIPLAFAPLAYIAGDYYEIGSIVASGLASSFVADPDPMRWRSDDLPKLIGELFVDGPFRVANLLGVIVGFVLGVVGAWATYGSGRLVARGYARLARRGEARA